MVMRLNVHFSSPAGGERKLDGGEHFVVQVHCPLGKNRCRRYDNQKKYLHPTCKVYEYVPLMVQNSGDHQLRLVVYPIIYRVLYIPGGCLGFLPSTVAL